MKVSDYIRQTFGDFGVALSDANLLTILLSTNISGEDEVNGNNIQPISVGMAKFIPSLLLRGTSKSVSENGHSKSQSWDIQGIKDYYFLMCKRYGLKDELNTDNQR